MRRYMVLPLIGLLVMGLAIIPASAGPGPATHDIRPGEGVSESYMLSRYFPGLAGTPGDTPVYVLAGSKPGPTMLILGGTHGDEISGAMSATLLIERARVEAGRLIVVPRANNSASTYNQPGLPSRIELKTPSGVRHFAYGSRRTNPAHQEPDRAEFYHFPSGQEAPGDEARNLNRVHPGKADGSLTQKIAYAFFQLILKEKPAVSIDFHEAGPESRLAYMVIGNPKCVDLAAIASLNTVDKGISFQIDQSSTQRGLTHREWGDMTSTRPFIIETPNPGQGNNTKGVDVVNDPKFPLAIRVGAHITLALELFEAYAETSGDVFIIKNVPSYADLKKNGVGFYLN